MRGICDRVRCFLGDESGATAIEYGLIAGLIAVGALVAMTLTGTSVTSMFDYVSDRSVDQLDNINDI
ncbi:MAG TPA: Flp family type IVb pilin [Devosia sp.]|jgi:pilus assembly protein Flp/PilA|uniref:Flp family type IVb pilin n=1 Tax=Devosia sp. TaxID=1871048 RepID=UPI002DDCF593|nr:Flp family type IVb pilin [Devosia sp.]HEV2513722.1 Flp family type IVb pilin [Devosia sp.]